MDRNWEDVPWFIEQFNEGWGISYAYDDVKYDLPFHINDYPIADKELALCIVKAHNKVLTEKQLQKEKIIKEYMEVSAEIGEQLPLKEVTPRIKRTCWLNLYVNGHTTLHDTKEWADKDTVLRQACVKIEIDCEEGEGC